MHLARQQIPTALWNTQLHCFVAKPGIILCFEHTNPDHTLTICLYVMHFNIGENESIRINTKMSLPISRMTYDMKN